MSASRWRGSHAASFIGWRTLASSSPTASQLMPGRQIAWRGRFGFIVSRMTSPLILRYEFVSPVVSPQRLLAKHSELGVKVFLPDLERFNDMGVAVEYGDVAW